MKESEDLALAIIYRSAERALCMVGEGMRTSRKELIGSGSYVKYGTKYVKVVHTYTTFVHEFLVIICGR